MHWKNEKLIDWIRETPPFWGHDIIRDMDQDYPEHNESVPGVMPFVYLVEHTSEDIDPDTIVGQWDHYAGQTWLDAIFKPDYKPGKIMSCLNKADSNPGYYFNKIDGIQLTSFDGKNWYSHTGGNHRTIIGKFMTAMAEAKTGEKHYLSGISTTRYHIDYEYFNMYKKLALLIREMGLKITLDARSEPQKNWPNNFELKIFVHDSRKGLNVARYGWLSTIEFGKFAMWVLEHNGKYPIWYQVKDFFGLLPGFEQQKLIYPRMSGQHMSAPRMGF